MNILDTNAVQYFLENNIVSKNRYYLTPDVYEECEITELVLGKKIPSNIKELSSDDIHLSFYLNNYRLMLNKFRGRSFYNMTGFGDISILAYIKTFIEITETSRQPKITGMEEKLNVFTQDGPLVIKINNEFSKHLKTGILLISNHMQLI